MILNPFDGPIGFLLKHAAAHELVAAIREVLQGRVYVSALISRRKTWVVLAGTEVARLELGRSMAAVQHAVPVTAGASVRERQREGESRASRGGLGPHLSAVGLDDPVCNVESQP